MCVLEAQHPAAVEVFRQKGGQTDKQKDRHKAFYLGISLSLSFEDCFSLCVGGSEACSVAYGGERGVADRQTDSRADTEGPDGQAQALRERERRERKREREINI